MKRWFGPVVDDVVEWFRLREAAATAARLGPSETRERALRDALAEARQKARAATALRLDYSGAEALRLARAAFDVLARAVAELADAPEDRPPDAAEGPPGAARLRRFVDEVRARVDPAGVPAWQKDFRAEHERALGTLLRAVRRLDRDLLPLSRGPSGIRALRRRRLAGLIAAGLALLAGVVALVGLRWGLRAEASAVLGQDHAADHAVDGDPRTEWALPNGETGWLDVRIWPSRRASRIRLLNSRNAPHDDRGTKDFRVDLFYEGRQVEVLKGAFQTFPENRWLSLPVHDLRIDRLRLHVDSYHGVGGGIAEVEVD
jgi:hypothetical protein